MKNTLQLLALIAAQSPLDRLLQLPGEEVQGQGVTLGQHVGALWQRMTGAEPMVMRAQCIDVFAVRRAFTHLLQNLDAIGTRNRHVVAPEINIGRSNAEVRQQLLHFVAVHEFLGQGRISH